MITSPGTVLFLNFHLKGNTKKNSFNSFLVHGNILNEIRDVEGQQYTYTERKRKISPWPHHSTLRVCLSFLFFIFLVGGTHYISLDLLRNIFTAPV